MKNLKNLSIRSFFFFTCKQPWWWPIKDPKALATISVVNSSTNSKIKTKTLVRKLEKILIKSYWQNVLIIKSHTHTHTHTHTHAHTHTHIYIYIWEGVESNVLVSQPIYFNSRQKTKKKKKTRVYSRKVTPTHTHESNTLSRLSLSRFYALLSGFFWDDPLDISFRLSWWPPRLQSKSPLWSLWTKEKQVK